VGAPVTFLFDAWWTLTVGVTALLCFVAVGFVALASAIVQGATSEDNASTR
jgi:hypothetical protein